MSCTEQHLRPISSEVNPNWPDPAPEPPKKSWGGRRKGAGAPKGNLNGFRHGKYSTQHKELVRILADLPEAEQLLLKLALRRKAYDKKKQQGADLLFAEILRRLGEIILQSGPCPKHCDESCDRHNHLELNQQLVPILRQLESVLQEIAGAQSSEHD